MVLRNDATITLDSKVERPKVEARIGTKLTANDENNQEITLEAVYILDTYELERYIESGNNRYKNTQVGDRNGQVSAQMRDSLKGAVDNAEIILGESTDITEARQKLIDDQVEELRSKINEFVNAIVRVNRYELQEQIRKAENMARSGEYSGETLSKLEKMIKEARNFHSKYDVSQDEIDDQIKILEKYIDEIVVGIEADVSFIIKGLQENDYAHPRIALHQKEYEGSRNYSDEDLDYKIEKLDDGIRINIDLKGISRLEDAHIFILYGGREKYLFIEKIFLDEVNEGLVREIQVDDTFIPLEVSIPTSEDIVEERTMLHLVNEMGDRISSRNLSLGTKIPSGTYHFQHNAVTETQSYSLFKENQVVDKNNRSIIFEKDELVVVDIEILQDSAVNYELESIVPMHKSFDSISHPKLPKNSNSIYLSKGSYRNINPVLILEKNDEYLRYVIGSRGSYDLDSDKTIKVNNNFKIRVEWINEDEQIDINQSLGNYMNNYDFVVNDLGQEMDWLWRVEPSGSGYYQHLGQVNAVVVIKANGKEYSNEINGLRFRNITIKDIIGDANVTGEATIEFRLDSLPIDIEPFIGKIVIKE